MARCREQVDRIEPVLQWRTCALKGRSSAGVDVPAAELAAIGRTLRQAVVLSRLRTLRILALPDAAVAQIHDVLKAGIVVRVSLEKVLDRKLCHVLLSA